MPGSFIAGTLVVCAGTSGQGGGMTRSGQEAERPPLADIVAGGSGSAEQAGDSGLGGKATLGLVGLGMLGHVLRSRRFYEKVAVAAIVLGALRGLGHESRVSTFQRLGAWDKRQARRLEGQAKRQARHLDRKARRLQRKAKRQARRLTA
jgi:hypothetical protein